MKRLLGEIQSGAIRCVAVDTAVPSPFCHEILNANPYAYLDDAPLEERRARAVSLRRILPQTVVAEVGMLDPAAIREVLQQATPDIRNADDLHDTLLSLIALPEVANSFPHLQASESWGDPAGELARDKRAGVAICDGMRFWFPAERSALFRAAYPRAEILQSPAAIDFSQPFEEEAIFKIIQGWMPYCGPTTILQLASTLKLSPAAVDAAMVRLESTGVVLRGNFSRAAGATEWCDRRLLARIHRMTLGSLRKQIEPVTPAQFLRWLFRWQHVAPGTQLLGERGACEALGQLQGLEIPAREWEKQILPRRIADYHSSMLDRLCWTGTVGWRCLSGSSRSRKLPGNTAPISFFLREDCDWLPSKRLETDGLAQLTSEARLVHQSLKQRGASFLSDRTRFNNMRRVEVETALWELVTAGAVTADGFDSLRALLDSRGKSRSVAKAGAGRWSLLENQDPAADNIEAICRLLLHRYGVIFRDLLQRETILPRWRELLLMLRRMEDRGEVRGGRFEGGFVGEQFALPLAVDSLRAIRKIEPDGQIVALSPADPLNLTGILVPGERIPIVSRQTLLFRDGVPLPPVTRSAF